MSEAAALDPGLARSARCADTTQSLNPASNTGLRSVPLSGSSRMLPSARLRCSFCMLFMFVAAVGFASPPTLTVVSPKPGTVGVPTFFDATATTLTCHAGIAAIRIYTAPGVHPFTTKSPHLETFLNLQPGNYNIVLKAWDNCGGVSSVPLSFTAVSAAGVHLFLPVSSSNTTPVHVAASAESPACSSGMAAMRLYTGAQEHLFTARGDTLNVFVNLRPGIHGGIAQAWDNCGNVFKAPFTVRISGGAFGKFLYLAQEDQDNIAEFRLNKGNVANPNGSNPPPQFALPDAPESFAVDPSGNFAYAGLRHGRVVVFNINRATGALLRRTSIPTQGTLAAFVTVDRSGNFLFVSESGSDTVASYRIDRSSGDLTFVGRSQTGPIPIALIALTTDWKGRYVYVINQGLGFSDYTIFTLSGKLIPLAVQPIPAAGTFAIAATDKVVYEHGSGFSSGFNIGPNGTVTPVPGSPFPSIGCADFSNTMVLDPIHNLFLYASFGCGFSPPDSLRISQIQPDGALSPIGTTIFGLALPKPVTLDPSFRFLYTSDLDPMTGIPQVASITYAPDASSGKIVSVQTRPAASP